MVAAGFFAYASYRLTETLKSVNKLVEDTQDITQDVRELKENVKQSSIMRFVGFINQLIGKRGDVYVRL